MRFTIRNTQQLLVLLTFSSISLLVVLAHPAPVADVDDVCLSLSDCSLLSDTSAYPAVWPQGSDHDDEVTFAKRGGPIGPATAASFHGIEGLHKAAYPFQSFFRTLKYHAGRPLRYVKKFVRGGKRPVSPTHPPSNYVPLHPLDKGYQEAVKMQEGPVRAALARGRLH